MVLGTEPPERAGGVSDLSRRESPGVAHPEAHARKIIDFEDGGGCLGYGILGEEARCLPSGDQAAAHGPALYARDRKGAGYYNAPPPRRVRYRGPFGHNGAAKFPGHPFGFGLRPGDRKAPIAFLQTL